MPFQFSYVHYYSFSDKLLPNILKLKDRLPNLKTIIIFGADNLRTSQKSLYQDLKIISFQEIESKGSGTKKDIAEILTPPLPSDPAVIMYTSGSTGEPKAQFD